MSKRARVDLANVLVAAGYDRVKTLRAIKYPFCIQILANVQYADFPTDDCFGLGTLGLRIQIRGNSINAYNGNRKAHCFKPVGWVCKDLLVPRQ